MLLSLTLVLSFAMNNPAAENTLSASADVGGIVFKASSNFIIFDDHFSVDSNGCNSCFTILSKFKHLLIEQIQVPPEVQLPPEAQLSPKVQVPLKSNCPLKFKCPRTANGHLSCCAPSEPADHLCGENSFPPWDSEICHMSLTRDCRRM
ncbi:hypothetical protein AVEN_225980-1 [Araneus ventricosus]|uniref:Uncharacterized protein n=1 Tax=Araneus ventricosus TaxID=182803 RepID=A0A4Y2KEU7_ARAVE|nr:hypothetical protein AVEN_225980-1 [Araneus ventricosus]